MFRSPLSLSVLAGLFLLLLGCAESQQSLGEAYVAPASLNVRSQLSQKSNSVATLKHGDAVAIVDTLRRMVKVRTATGFEGWVDSRELLSREQMRQLRHEREVQARLPSEGTATAFETLNIHIAPSRAAAAFTQIPEGASVTILGRQIAPKIAPPARTSLLFEKPAAPARRSRKEAAARQSFRLPPKPKPPKAPENWRELSTERIDGEQPKVVAAPAEPQQKAKPVVMEDWTLVRTAKAEIGWVLSRNLMMSIPDEVAQYAEGKHITSFFELGQVNDAQKGVKRHWLWTTLSGALPYDFDSWRVFLWNARRHRYETSYRQRDLEGYFPVHVDPAEAGKTRTFQLVTKDRDGKLRKRSYAFDGTLVRLTGTEDYLQNGAARAASALNGKKLQPKTPRPNWLRRKWTGWKTRLFGAS
jgi:Bacterial SH3 domain